MDKNIPQLSEQMKTNYVSVVISFGIIENGLKEWKENGGKKMHLIAFYKSKNDTCSLVKVHVNVKFQDRAPDIQFFAYFLTYPPTPVRFCHSVNFHFYIMISNFGKPTQRSDVIYGCLQSCYLKVIELFGQDSTLQIFTTSLQSLSVLRVSL